MEKTWIHILNVFVYYISLPTLLLVSFWNIDWAQREILPTLGFNFLAIFIFAAFVFLALSLSRLKNQMKATVFLTVMVGNTVYIGFPMMSDAFGAENFGHVAAVATAHLVVGLILAIMMIEFWVLKSKNPKVYLNDFIKNPLIHAIVLGIGLSLIGFEGYVAELIKRPLAMLGATASPVALFALGGFMRGKFIQKNFGLTSVIVGLKILVFPLFLLLLANWFNLNAVTLGVSVLSAAVPVAVTTFVIAEQYKLDKAFVGNAILLSTAASVFTLSVFLLFFV